MEEMCRGIGFGVDRGERFDENLGTYFLNIISEFSSSYYFRKMNAVARLDNLLMN